MLPTNVVELAIDNGSVSTKLSQIAKAWLNNLNGSVAFGRNFMLNQTETVHVGKKYWNKVMQIAAKIVGVSCHHLSKSLDLIVFYYITSCDFYM